MKRKSFNISVDNAENRMQLSGAKVAVLGAARSGIALAKLLIKAGAQVLLSEYKAKSEVEIINLPNVMVEFGGHSEKVLDADLICMSPGIPLDIPILQAAKEKNIPQIGELEVASWFCDAPVIAITGSNGKTTTTTLIGEMYQAFFESVIVGGNIGIPFSELVFNNADLTPGPSPSRRGEQESPPLLEGEGDLGGEVRTRPIHVKSAKKTQTQNKKERFAVVEVSSFQLETIANFKPNIAIITNFSPNHLDRYPSYEAYISAKLEMLKNMSAADVLIYNDDDSLLREKVQNVKCRKIPFSNQHVLAEGGFWKNDTMHISWQGKNGCIPVEKTALRGSHNRYNMVAAVIAAVLNDIPVEIIQNVLENISPIEHRLENVAVIDDVVYVNDSKATSVLALECALKSFSKPLVLIAGGKDKGGDFSDLNALLKEKARAVVVIGEAAARMTSAWQNILPVYPAETLETAIQKANKIAESGDAVLLSPACSSFDMFDNFEQRGKKFKEIVNALKDTTVYETV